MLTKHIMLRHLTILFLSFCLCSCNDNVPKEHLNKKHLGIYFDRDDFTGAYYTDNNGNTCLYRSIATTITNDSTLPIHVTLDFLNKLECKSSVNERVIKIFILPKELAGEKQYIYPGVSPELKKYLDFEISKNSSLSELVNPNEELTITLGILDYDKNYGAAQMAIISNRQKPRFISHDSIIEKSIADKNPFDLFIALDFWYSRNDSACFSYSCIPCGQISYAKE